MKTIASRQTSVDELRVTRLITLRTGEKAVLTFDRETVTSIDGVPVEASRRDRQQFQIDGSEDRTVDLAGVKYTLSEIAAALEQLADDVEDEAVKLASDKAAELAKAAEVKTEPDTA